ncbi:hypothetical protein [uncultured Winogradskyella sp.]|uniref:hypothetical protein n=1 Tax=uncultured Winogradskyella sp. TaxID=395353 RepID=UPI00260203C5|nr:hypothetical protein [uncultured Winogradskyella sp.]
MIEEHHIILKNCLRISIFSSAFIGVFYFKKLKKSYWKWFSVYLIIIFIQEGFWAFNTNIDREYRFTYYTLLGIPLQYLFFFWLYAFKSLKKKKIFLISSVSYLFILILAVLFKNIHEANAIGINIGTIILIGLIILEFVKQVKTDNILKFKVNKMFYINIGVVLFYIGNYPYHVLGPELHKNYYDIWSIYRTYFLTTNCIMYLLFSASFIWGKTH